MGEIKKKLNINKITVKNLFLVVLLMTVLAVVGAITKLAGSKAAGINTAEAQSCWTVPEGGGGCDCLGDCCVGAGSTEGGGE